MGYTQQEAIDALQPIGAGMGRELRKLVLDATLSDSVRQERMLAVVKSYDAARERAAKKLREGTGGRA